MDIILKSIIIAVVLLLLSIGIYYFLRFLRGSLKLKLEKTSFQIPEEIKGKVSLNVKQEITCNRLFVAVVCYEERKDYSNGSNSSRKIEISRFEKNLENERIFNSNFKKEYDFSIPFPVQVENNLNRLSTGNSTADSIIRGVVNSTSKISKKIYWKLEVRLDAKGIDLFTSKKIYLNFNKI